MLHTGVLFFFSSLGQLHGEPKATHLADGPRAIAAQAIAHVARLEGHGVLAASHCAPTWLVGLEELPEGKGNRSPLPSIPLGMCQERGAPGKKHLIGFPLNQPQKSAFEKKKWATAPVMLQLVSVRSALLGRHATPMHSLLGRASSSSNLGAQGARQVGLLTGFEMGSCRMLA